MVRRERTPTARLRPVTAWPSAGDDIRPQTGRPDQRRETRSSRPRSSSTDISVTTAVRSTCYEMRYAAERAAGGGSAEHGGLLRPGLGRRAGRVRRSALRLDRHPPVPQRHPAWPRRTAGHQPRSRWSWSGGSTPSCLRRCATNHCSTSTAGTSALLTSSIVEAGVVGQYHGGLHLLRRPAGDRRTRPRSDTATSDSSASRCSLRIAGTLARMAERMHAARRRARWEAESQRRWTIEHPPWWTPTHTVELRRAADAPNSSERLLRYRAA